MANGIPLWPGWLIQQIRPWIPELAVTRWSDAAKSITKLQAA